MSGTLGGTAIARARAQIPAWGVPWFDVDLAEPADFERGEVPALVVAGQSIAATVVSGGTYEGKSAYRLAAGRAAWGKTLPRKPYLNDANVSIATVLGDLARETGETVADAPATKVGPHFARVEGPASATLNALAPRNWYVGFDGVTRIGQRAASTYQGDAPRTRVDVKAGLVELAVESVAGLVPGVTVDSVGPACDVEWLLEPSRLTVRVWAGTPKAPRRVAAIWRIVEPLVAPLRYAGHFEYRVVTQSGNRFNLQPVRASSGLPDLASVPMRPGIPGAKASALLGSLVLVVFADRDPSRPQVVAWDAPDAPGWLPTTCELGTGALGIARITDAVQAGPFAGAITGGSARFKAGL